MKINQEQIFKPITITIESQEEADNFIAAIDQLDKFYCNANHELELSKEIYTAVKLISDLWPTRQSDNFE